MNIDTLSKCACFTHSRQVAKISAWLAESIGYSPDEAAVVEQAGLFHDIGKSDIPKQILNKPGALTQDEYAIVKTHTALGYNKIIEAINALTIAAAVCRDHHERPDGSGYYGSRDTHPYAKLIAVADVFDALYSKRAYKDAWDMDRIKSYFHTQAGTQFDADIVRLLFSDIETVLLLYQPLDTAAKA